MRSLRLRPYVLLRAIFASLAAIAFLGIPASSLFGVFLIARPFNHHWSIHDGVIDGAWFVRGPNGSISGFGGPAGFRVIRSASPDLRWRPKYSFNSAAGLLSIRVPLWLICVTMGAASAAAHRAAVRSRDPRTCPACEYSRRGLPPDAPCPECGKVPGAKSSAHASKVQPRTRPISLPRSDRAEARTSITTHSAFESEGLPPSASITSSSVGL